MIGCRLLFGPVTFLALLAPSHASAAQQSTASALANAEIVGPALNLTAVNPLAFGRIKSTGPGTVIVDVRGIRTATGLVVLIGSGQCREPPCDTTNPSNPSSASFWSPGVLSVSGVAGAAYRVSVPTTATAILKSGSNAPMTLDVTDVVVATESGDYDLPHANTDTGILNASGQDMIRVGGTLQVTAPLNASSYYLYSVDVPVTVMYN